MRPEHEALFRVGHVEDREQGRHSDGRRSLPLKQIEMQMKGPAVEHAYHCQ